MAIKPYGVSLEAPATASPNVKDLYKASLTEEVRADLDTKRTPVVQVFMNITHDFNKASAIRANNCFLGRKVYLVGNRRYDKRGTVGTHNYEHVFHADTFEEVCGELKAEGYTLVAVDNVMEEHPQNLFDVVFPEKVAFVYGEEQAGLSPEVIKACDLMVYIATEGSCRSLNVAAASAVLLFEYSRQQASKAKAATSI